MAEKEVGLRATLKDRRETVAGLASIRDEVDKSGDAVDDAGRKAEGSSSRWKRMGGALGKVAKVAGAVALATGAMAVGVGKALYNVGATFDDMSDTIRVGTGATGKHLDRLVGSAKRVGKQIPVELGEIGPAIADINTRLGLTGKPLEKLTKQTLMAGKMMGEAIDVNAMSSAFSVFEVKGKGTSRALDDIYRVSQATGVGMNDLLGSVAKNGPALQQFGLGFRDSAAWIGNLDKAGLNSNKTLGALSKAMVGFAKDGLDPKVALRGTIDEMQAFLAKGNEVGAINVASKIFGTKGAGQFVAAVKDGQVNLDTLMAKTGASGDTILGASKDTEDFTEKWQLFKNRALLAVEPIATRVFNAVGDGMDKINRDVVPMVQNFIAEMRSGKGAGGKFADALDRAKDIAEQVGTAIKDTGGFLLKYKGVVLGLTGAVVALVAITKLHTAVMAIQAAGGLMVMIKNLPIITAMTRAWAAVQWLLNIAMSANPVTLIILGIIALIAIIAIAWVKCETFRNIVTGAFGKVKDAVMGVVGWIKSNWPLLLAILTGPIGLAVLAIVKNWDKIKAGATAVKDWIVEKFNAVVGFIGGLPGQIKAAASGMWDGIKSAFASVLNWIIDKWNALQFDIPEVSFMGMSIGGGTIGVPKIPPVQLAEGGIVRRTPGGILANIGEGQWDEAVVPMDGRQYLVDGSGVTPLPAAQGMSGADVDAFVSADGDDGPLFPPDWSQLPPIHVHVEIDGKEVGEAVIDDFEERLARK